MGKRIVVKGASFSANALPTDYELITSWAIYNSNRAYTSPNVNIQVGKEIGFLDENLYYVYKYAISKTSSFPSGSWDTSYTGSAYLTQSVVLANVAVYLFVARIDNAEITDDDITALSHNFYIR